MGEIVGHANLLLSISSGTLVLFDEFVRGDRAPVRDLAHLKRSSWPTIRCVADNPNQHAHGWIFRVSTPAMLAFLETEND
jgi:hypothetical protein